MRPAIYPGSFDPVTCGHLDIIERGARLFGGLTIAVLQNEAKLPLFRVEERVEMLREAVAHLPDVAVESFAGLLADYARQKQAAVLLRGVRAIADYEYERQMEQMNRRLFPGLETVFLLAREEHAFISSRLVKEVSRLGGDIRGLVPAAVEERLLQKRH